ncbi:DUF3606 domain-containing protein [Pedobacter sp. PWIIR3]
MKNTYEESKMSNNEINVLEYYEVEYWAKHFRVRPESIRLAVQRVGNLVTEVKKFLGK